MSMITLQPVVSEQSFAAAGSPANVYTFYVTNSANKHQIKEAVEAQYGVAVESVNVAIRKGKSVSTYKKRSRPVTANRVDTKKAYVRLKKGDSIAVFEGVEE